MLPITTTTKYGVQDEMFSSFPVDENTIKVLITDEHTRDVNYKPTMESTVEGTEIVGLQVGPDFDASELIEIFNSQERLALEIFIPRWIDQSTAFEVNERLVKLHVDYLETILSPVK